MPLGLINTVFTVYSVIQKTEDRGEQRTDFRFTDIMKKMVLERDRQLFALLMFIKEHETDETGISRERVVKHMNANNISSRVTTLNMINVLLQERALIDDDSIPFQSNLKINSDFDFRELWAELFVSEHLKIKKKLDPLKYFIFGGDRFKQFMKDSKTWENKYENISRELINEVRNYPEFKEKQK